MKHRNTFKVILGVVVVMALALNPLYAAPKEGKVNKGKAKGHAISRGRHNTHNDSIQRNHALKAIFRQDRRKVCPPALLPQTVHTRKNKQLLEDLESALNKFEHSKWFYNPHDDRGQGNMGKVDMLDPYGHDKDSDRLALYGNRGRVIRIVEPLPEPEPPPSQDPPPEPESEPEPAPIFEPPVLP